MGTRLEHLRDEARVRLEVDRLRLRVRRKPGPIEDDELEPLGQRQHRSPRRPPVRDAAVHEHDSRPRTERLDVHPSTLQTSPFKRKYKRFALSQALVCSRLMEPSPRQSFHPLGAGFYLLGVIVAALLVGLAIGWLAGSWEIGMLVGAILGIPLGVFAVYRRYRGAFS
jgi:F0F1-type ATP synthase assembly protein I